MRRRHYTVIFLFGMFIGAVFFMLLATIAEPIFPVLPNTVREDSETKNQLPTKLSGNIFFHETSEANSLNRRQACSVESAAKMNPDTVVRVYMTSPNIDLSTSVMKRLLYYQNVEFVYLNLTKHFMGTPLEDLFKSGDLLESKWPIHHTSHVVRFLTLWKFGGIYLDLDIIVMSCLKGLRNFAAIESSEFIGPAVLGFEKGHPISKACVDDLSVNFNGQVWTANGPAVITRVLKSVCQVNDFKLMTAEKCNGFGVYDSDVFYPIHWDSWKKLFNEENSDKTVNNIVGSLAVHVWNRLSQNEEVKCGSKQPYVLLAQTYCPKVYSLCDQGF